MNHFNNNILYFLNQLHRPERFLCQHLIGPVRPAVKDQFFPGHVAIQGVIGNINLSGDVFHHRDELSALFFIETFAIPWQEHKALWRGVRWFRGAKLMAALFVYVAVFQVLGFILSTFLLLVFLFKGLEPQSWRTALLLSAVTVAICYLVFGVFLELQFPPGLLRFILA